MPKKNETINTVEVLPPETSLPATVAGYTPEQVTGQYKKAVSGTIEVFRFGGMLMDLDRSLTCETPKNKNQHTPKEQTLKGWLEEHCPDVNYKSAMRFKGYAEEFKEFFKLPKSLPVTLALPAPDGTINVHLPDGCRVSAEKVKKIQVEVWETVEGKSMRQLLMGFMTESKQRGGDRKSGKDTPKLTETEKLEQQKKDAGEYWKTTAESMLFQIKRAKSHKLLTTAQIEQLLVQLRVVKDGLEEAKGAEDKGL